MHGLQACYCCCIMLSVVKMLLKGEDGGRALKSHGNYIVDQGKSWNCVLEFLWEPCLKLVLHLIRMEHNVAEGNLYDQALGLCV